MQHSFSSSEERYTATNMGIRFDYSLTEDSSREGYEMRFKVYHVRSYQHNPMNLSNDPSTIVATLGDKEIFKKVGMERLKGESLVYDLTKGKDLVTTITKEIISRYGGNIPLVVEYCPRLYNPEWNYDRLYSINETIRVEPIAVNTVFHGVYDGPNGRQVTGTLYTGRTYYAKSGIIRPNHRLRVSAMYTGTRKVLYTEPSSVESTMVRYDTYVPFTISDDTFYNVNGYGDVSIYLETIRDYNEVGRSSLEFTLKHSSSLRTSTTNLVSGYNRNHNDSFFDNSEEYSQFILTINKSSGGAEIRYIETKMLVDGVEKPGSLKHYQNGGTISLDLPYHERPVGRVSCKYRIINTYGITSDWNTTDSYLTFFNYKIPTLEVFEAYRFSSKSEKQHISLRFSIEYFNSYDFKNRVSYEIKYKPRDSNEWLNMVISHKNEDNYLRSKWYPENSYNSSNELEASKSYELMIRYKDSIDGTRWREVIKIIPGAFVHMDFGPAGVAIGKDHIGKIEGTSETAVFEVQGNMNLTSGDYYKDGKSLEDIINDKINEGNLVSSSNDNSSSVDALRQSVSANAKLINDQSETLTRHSTRISTLENTISNSPLSKVIQQGRESISSQTFNTENNYGHLIFSLSISFSKAFSTIPTVVVTLEHPSARDTYIPATHLTISEVTTSGFKVHHIQDSALKTFSGAHLHWIAISNS